MSRFTRWFDRAQFPSRSARRRRQRKADLRLRPLRLESLEERRLLSLTTDSFSGGVLTVDFNAADNVAITSSGGNVLVNGANPTTGAAAVGSVTAINITGTGNFDNTIDLSGVSAAQGFSNLATVTIAAGGAVNGDTILLGPLNASGAVNVSSVGPSQITLAAGVAAGSLVIAPGILSDIYLDGGVTTSGAQDYAAPAWIGADAVLSAGNGNITFGSTLDGAHNVTLDSSGATTFAGVVGGADSLSSLTTDAAGSTVIDASITTSGSGGLTLNDPVTLGGDVTLSAGFNPVTIASTIDGDYALAIDSSDLALNGAIGSSEPLASLSTNISFNATFRGGSISTIGYQWYDNDIMLAADATFDAGKSTLLFQSGLDGAYAATLKSAGLIELTGSVGSRTPLADLTTDGTGTTSIGEDVNSTGNQTYNNAVSVESYSALIAGTGNITFNGPIEGGGLETSTKGTTTFNSPVGTSAILASLTTDAGGTTVLNAGSIDTNSAVTFNNNVVLPVNTSIDASSTQFAGAIDGPGSLSTEAGNTTFAGAIGGTTPLNALNVVASFTTLSADTTINVGSGGVTFGFVNGAHALAITSAGLASLTAAIGNSSPPTTLSVVAAGPITLYGDITTSGNQVYSHPATIGSGTILTSTGGTISYASTAPFLTSTAPTLPAVSTNEAASTTETVSTLIGGLIVDNNDSYGIAINGQTTPGGAWQYSLDGSTWGNFGAVGATQSLLLAPADFVRFVPDGVDTGTATFSYRAWDQSTGAAGTVVDTTANGGNTAFSVASATASIAVQIPSVLTSETFSDGVLTIGLGGPQNVAIASGAGELLVNGASPNAGAVLASAVTAIDITGTAGTYDNTIDLSGVSAAQGFSSLDTVSIDAGGSLAGDQILLGALNASGLVSITGTGIATVTAASGSVVAGSVSVTTEALKLTSAITITTTGDQLYNSDISIASGVNVSTSNGDITFNGTVNGYGLLTVSSPQLTAFNATVGGAVPLSGLTVDSGGRTVLAASVTAATLDLFSPVTLSANLTLGSATFDIANTIDGAYALTIDTSSPLSIAAALGSITPLASLTIIAASTNFNGGEVTTTGSQTYDTAFVLQSDATFNAGSSPILFDSSLDGAHNAVFDTSATTTLVGNLGAKTALASLTTDGGGTTAIEGDLTTTGKQTYNGQVTVGTSTVLNAGSAGIVFNGSIDGGILMCNSIGTTWFNAPIGTTSLLGSLTLEGGGTTILAGRYLETTSGMTFYDPVVLASDMTVSSDSFVGFDSTVDGTYNLNLDQSPAYYAAFIGAVGSSTPLASLTVSGDTVSFGNVATLGDVTTIGSQLYLASTVDLDGLYDSTGSSIHIIGAAMVDGNSAIDAAGVVTVNTVNGPSSLNIVSGGLVTFDGEVGNTPLNTLTVSSPSGIDVNANVTTTGNQIYSLPVNVATGVSLTSETGSVSKVASVSTAPVLTSIAPTMNPTVVNADSYPEEDVGDLIGSSITDDNDVYNIAVESVSTSGGTWQYSSDDAKTWTDFGTVSATQSLVLLSSDIVRFLAGAEVGTATFTYRATDQAGVGGELVDTTTNGGNSAFSAATDTTSVVVQIAPVITTDTFSGGVLTVDVDGPENVSIGSSGGRVLIDGNNPTTGVALASAVTVIDITASAGQYDNSITLTGVSAAQGFTSLASVSVNTGGSYFADHVTLGTLNASGLVSLTGARSDSVSVPGTLVAGSLSITATALSLGSVTTTGNQTYNAPVRLSNAATLSAGSGNVTFNNTVDGSYSLTINSSGATTFAGTVGGHAEPTSLTTDSAGSTVIGASLAVIDNININDPLTLAGNVTLDGGLAANGYSTAVNIKSTIDGPYALVIDSRNMSLVGAIGSTTPLASLVVGATSSAVFGSMDTLSGGSITTTGPQTINVDLRLSANTTFSAGSSTILVQGGLLGDSATFNTAGLTDLTPGIFMGIQVNSVTTDAAGTTTISGAVYTSGNQTYNDPVTIGLSASLFAIGGSITFNGTLDGGALSTDATGTTTFNGAVGKTAPLTSLFTQPSGTTVLAGGTIATSSGIRFDNAVVLDSDMSVVSSGGIAFNGTVDGPYNLSICQNQFAGDAWFGEEVFAGSVGSSTSLMSLTTVGNILSLKSVTTTGSQTYNNQSLQLDGLYSAGTGPFSITNPVTLLGNTVINAPGEVNLDTVDGAYGLNIVSGGATTLDGQIGQIRALASVTAIAADGVDINANVTTTGNQIYGQSATVGPGVFLTSTAGTVSQVASVDTAPLLTPIEPTLPAANLSEVGSTPVPVGTMVANSITDDNGLYGIAVVGQSTPGGSWQYSLDGGATWANFGAVSGTQSLLLAPTDLVRFAPDGVDTGTGTFRYRAWNLTTGSAGTLADTTTSGGNAAFSTAMDTSTTVVQIAPVVTTDTFSAGVLTVDVDGPQNVTITESGGQVLVNGENPTTGAALASAVTAINITATAGNYDNVFDLTGVSAAQGFTSLATVAINVGGSYFGDEVELGELDASGLVSVTGSGSDAVTRSGALVAGSVSITGTTLVLNSVTTTGAQTYDADVTLASNSTLSAGSGNISFGGTVDGDYSLTVDSSGVTTFAAAVGGNTALSSLTTDAAGSTVLDASITTSGSGGLTLNDPVTLGGNVDLEAGVNTVSINGTVDGAYALVIDTWNMALTGAIGSQTALASLTVSVPFTSTFSGGSISTTGEQTFDTDLTLGANTTFSAGSSEILIQSGLKGAYSATFDTSGLTDFASNLGDGTPLASVTTDAAGTTTINGNVTTTGNQTYNDPVTLGAFTTLNAGSGNITFQGSVDGGGLTTNTTGTTTFDGPVGANSVLGSLTTEGGTTVLAGGSIQTTFGITFGNAVILESDMSISNTGFAIEFNGTVNGDYNLSIPKSGLPGTTFAASVGGTTPLASLTSSGPTAIDGGTIATVGAQTYNGAVTLGALTTFTSTSAAGNITFASTIDASGAEEVYGFTVNSPALTSFEGAVGGPASVPTVSYVTVAGPLLVDGGPISTALAQTYSGAVTVGASTTFSSFAGAIEFKSTLDGGGNMPTVTLADTDGQCVVLGTVGGSAGAPDLAALNFNLTAGPSAPVIELLGNISTAGSQSYPDAVAILGNVTLTSTGIGASGAITFASTVGNPIDSSAYALTVDTAGLTRFEGVVGAPYATGAGTITLDAGLGGGTTVSSDGSVTITGNGPVAVPSLASLNVGIGPAEIDGGTVDTGATFTGPVTVTESTTFGYATFDSALDGSGGVYALTFSGATFDGNVGGSANSPDISSINVQYGTQVNGANIVTTSSQVYSDGLVVSGQTAFMSTTAVGLGFETNGGLFGSGPSASVTINSVVGTSIAVDTSGEAPMPIPLVSGLYSLEIEGGVTSLFGAYNPFSWPLGDVTVSTTGPQTYDAPISTLDAIEFISTGSGASGDITFGSTVDSDMYSPAGSIITQTSGLTDFQGVIGGSAGTPDLENVTVSGPAQIDGGAINTFGTQSYGGALTFTEETWLTSTGYNSAQDPAADLAPGVTFGSTVDSSGGSNTLHVVTPGQTVFDGAVGGSANAPDMQALDVEIGQGVFENSGVSTTSVQYYGGGASLGSATGFTSSGGGSIDFNGPIDGAFDLIAESDGPIKFASAVGENAPLASLTTEGYSSPTGGSTVISAPVNTSGLQTYDEPLQLQSTGSISEGVSFAAGTYQLQFLAEQASSTSAAQSLQVAVDGSPDGGSITPAGSGYSAYSTANFAAAAGAHTITIKSNPAGSGNSILLQNISIQPVDASQVIGPVVTINGTSGADTMAIDFTSASDFSITVDGATSSYSTQNINQIIVLGQGGADTLTVSDTYNTGVGTWNPQFMQWNTAMYQISAVNTQDIAFTGNQNDSATLNGTNGSDQATLTTTSVEMLNTGLFDNQVTGFGSAQVNAGGSAATAAIQDSGGGAVVGSAAQTSLSGSGYSYVAKGFQHVTATAGSSSDTVQLNPSAGYTVSTTASSSVLTGPGGAQAIVATGFSSQQQQQPPTAVVQSGPVLTVTGTSGADTMAINFTSAAAFSITVNGTTNSYSTQNINQIIVHGLGGADTLTVSDTFNTGVGTWNPQLMQWNSTKYQISADKTQDIVFTGKQSDSATLNGSTSSDQATLTSTSVEMSNTALFDNKITGFGTAQVVAGSSAATAAVQDSGGGAVVGSAAQTSLSGTGYSYVAKGFQHVTATAGSSSDTVQLNPSAGYTVSTTASSSVLTGPGGAQVIVATGFTDQQQQQPPTAVVQSGPVLTVTGTSGADTMAISFSSAAAFSITVNGTTSSYSTQNINQIIVHGLGGTDTLTVSDTYNTGVGTWNPQLMQWNSTKYQISADKTQDIVFTGKQSDSATLQGSTGSDQATLTTTSVEMSNTAQFDNKITGFGTAQVVAGSSSATAAIQDSGGGAVVGSAAQTSLTGTGYSYVAKGFQHVTATAGSGSDTVQLNASSGYTVATTASSSVLTGPGGAQVIVATGFAGQTQQPPTAVVQSGPVLTVTGTSGADTMTIAFSSAAAFSITVNGTTSSYSTQNINQIIVHGLGGTDTLAVSDTYNTGVGTWNPQLMQWNSAKYQISADKTQDIVFTGKQSDSATLNGSTGSDQATVTTTSVEMSNTGLFDNQVTGFGSAQVVAGSSSATAAIQDSGGGAVVGSAAQTSLTGTGYSYVAKGFQHVTATAGSGSDTVQLNASSGYTVATTANSTVLTGPGGAQVIVATGFSSQTQQQQPPTAVVQSGPVLTVTGTSGADTMTITFSSATAFSISVNGVTNAIGYSTQNINQIIVHGLGGADTLTVSDTFNTGVGTWSPQFMQWNTAKYQISADKTQDIAFTGKQNDSATLNGSTGSDQATLTATSVEMANTGLFDNQVTGFGSAQVVAGSSSAKAAVQASGGAAVVGTPTQTSLSGTDYSYVAAGFQRVTATAGTGLNTLQLIPSPGYTVEATASSPVLVGPDGAEVIVATGFSGSPTPVVQSGPVLTVTGTSGADTMAITFSSATAFSITVNGTTSSYSTQNINQIIVHGLGGADTLTVSDTFNTGVGTWSPQFMQWNTAKYQISADKTQDIAFTGKQSDSATFNGTTGSDQATLTTTSVEMANTALFDNKVTGFGSAQVVAGSASATASIQDSGGGAVVGTPTQTSLSGTGFSYLLTGFQYVSAAASSPADTVQLNPSAGYTVTTASGSIELVNSNSTVVIVATGFISSDSGSDNLAAIDSAFEQLGN